MPELKLNSKSSLSEIRKYERQLKKGYWLNRYHASWCSHCINMSEEWNNFTSHSINKDVRIASIEEQALSKLSEQPENFRGFPTITLTKNGEFVSEFNELRTSENLKNFINQYVPKSIFKNTQRKKKKNKKKSSVSSKKSKLSLKSNF